MYLSIMVITKKGETNLSERNCALQSKAYLALKEYYKDRTKAAYEAKKAGKKIVWKLGYDIPDEVILAAGMYPQQAFGKYDSQPMCDRFLEASFGPVWRGLFEQIVGGEHKDIMDHLVITKSGDMFVRLYYYLREIKRFEKDIKLPDLHFLELELILKNMRSQLWNEESIRLYIEQIESWSGKKITDEALKEAIAECNENRKALEEFSQLRYGENSRVTGSEALVVIGASLFMEKKQCTKLVRELTEEAKSWPVVDAKRLFFIGSVQEDQEVYEYIEELGANVVSEDHDWGDRSFEYLVDAEQRIDIALASRAIYRSPCGEQSLVDDHVNSVVEKVRKTGAQAVIIYMNFNDEAYLLEYPTLRDELKKINVPILCVTKQKVPMVDKDKFAEGIKALYSEMKGGN